MGFDTLGLSAPVLEAVLETGYTNPTPIQAQAIPVILEGKDVIGASQTGTTKTAAFALPSLSKIEKIGKPQSSFSSLPASSHIKWQSSLKNTVRRLE